MELQSLLTLHQHQQTNTQVNSSSLAVDEAEPVSFSRVRYQIMLHAYPLSVRDVRI